MRYYGLSGGDPGDGGGSPDDDPLGSDVGSDHEKSDMIGSSTRCEIVNFSSDVIVFGEQGITNRKII